MAPLLQAIEIIFASTKNPWLRLTRVAAAFFWLINKKTFARSFRYNLPCGGAIYLNPDHSLSSEILYRGGMTDQWELEFLRRFLQEGDCFVDGGANIGIYSLYAAPRVGESGKVIAFECNPDTYSALETNIRLNNYPQVTAVKDALAETEKEIEFEPNQDQRSRIASAQGNQQLIKIKTTTLDKAVTVPIRFLKLDLEGYEWFALMGAEKHLSSSGMLPVILIELLGHGQAYGKPDSAVISYLTRLGFGGYVYSRISQSLSAVNLSNPDHPQNLLFIHSRAFDEVVSRLARNSNAAK